METATRYPPIPPDAPYLFDDQDKPFAGDTFMERDFLALRDKYNLQFFVETGTCYGSTALWLAQHFSGGCTIEAVEAYAKIAGDRLAEAGCGNIAPWWGRSEKLISQAIGIAEGLNTIFFLDAHFEQHCPLLDELKAIAESGIKPVICVHDVFVPGRPDLGYDTWNGKRFTFEWLRPSFDRIYGRGGYAHKFNSEATGQMRGCLYVTPL